MSLLQWNTQKDGNNTPDVEVVDYAVTVEVHGFLGEHSGRLAFGVADGGCHVGDADLAVTVGIAGLRQAPPIRR